MRVSETAREAGHGRTSAAAARRPGGPAAAAGRAERLLMLQRTAGNQHVQALLAGGHGLQRDVGWTGKDIGRRSRNRGSMLVPGTEVNRVPVQGVKGGREAGDLETKMHDPVTGEAYKGPEVGTRTGELPGGGGGGRAIVLIPQWLPELDTVEVLFFLHGHMVGYREQGGVDDIDLYRFAQQLQAVKPRPMIAVLPQGGFYSEFGKGRKDVDVNAYIGAAMSLVPSSEWPNGAPSGPGGVVVSGHSGAGAPIASMLTGGEMPAGDQFEGLILFDSINTGPTKKKGDEYTPVRDAVLAHVDHDVQQLAAVKTPDKQLEWLLAHGFHFRAYHHGGDYTTRFLALKDEVDKGIDQRAAALQPPLDQRVLSALHDNYQVLPAGKGVEHLETMGGHKNPKTKQFEHENVKDALSHLGDARAVSRSTLQRWPWWGFPGTPSPPSDTDEVVDAVATAAAPLVGTASAASLHDVLQAQIAADAPRGAAPAGAAASPLAAVYTALYSTTTVGHLRRMTQTHKADALRRIYDRIAPSSVAGAALAAPPAGTVIDPEAEAALEEPLVDKDHIRDWSEGGWRAVRRAVLATFGAYEVGPTAAIQRANAYYQQLQPARLSGRRGHPVHPDMQARLDAATNALTPAERTTIGGAITDFGGFNIRPNRNNPASLSKHSFGWAVDINAAENPNVGGSGALGLVETVTGISPAAQSTSGKTAADAQTAAERLHKASADYVAAFHDDASIAAAMLSNLNAARTVEGMTKLDATAAEPTLAAARAADAKADAVAALMFPAVAGAAAPAPAVKKRQRRAAETLIKLHKVYRASFSGTDRVRASSEATAGSVAAHGFMNLPPRLVGVLTGRDAGRLVWLGTAGVHDYMHFELATAPALILPTAAPAAPAAPATPPAATPAAPAPATTPVPVPVAAGGEHDADHPLR